jgi:hypothetical protein
MAWIYIWSSTLISITFTVSRDIFKLSDCHRISTILSKCTYEVKIQVHEKMFTTFHCIAVRNVKKSPGQETGLGNRGCLKVLKDTKLVLNKHEWPPSSFKIIMVSFRTFKCPLFPKPVSCPGLFLQQDGSNFTTTSWKHSILSLNNLVWKKVQSLTIDFVFLAGQEKNSFSF